MKADKFLIVRETMFTVGDSQVISNANDTNQPEQVAANPRRGRVSTETPLENADLKFSKSNGEDDDSKKPRGAERTSLSTAKATPSARDSGYSDHKHVQRQRQTTITQQTKPMKKGNNESEVER